jgi:3-deoxy-D-manno-octulosonic-acid transferase
MMTPVTLNAYRAATALASPFAGMWLRARLARGKEDPDRLDERFGVASRPRPQGPLIWVHGASVGEAFSLDPILQRIAAAGHACLVTTGTVTSARMIASRLPPRAMHQFAPLDAPAPMRRFFAHWRPDLGLIAESEIWPNMIMAAANAHTPLGLINARMSQRSFSRWRRAPKFMRALLQHFEFCLAQTSDDAERWRAFGAADVEVSGNLKYDAPPPPYDREEFAVVSGALAGRKIWIAASTHAGEEIVAAEAHRAIAREWPEALTIIAPRHASRGAAIQEELAAQGFKVGLRSRGDKLGASSSIYVADTMGELGLFYRLAGVVFLGKSLVGAGGQNPIEPAKLGCALLHGPNVANFRDVYDLLDAAGGALRVIDGAELAERLAALFRDTAQQRQIARKGQHCVDAQGGAAERVMRRIQPWLPAPAP